MSVKFPISFKSTWFKRVFNNLNFFIDFDIDLHSINLSSHKGRSISISIFNSLHISFKSSSFTQESKNLLFNLIAFFNKHL